MAVGIVGTATDPGRVARDLLGRLRTAGAPYSVMVPHDFDATIATGVGDATVRVRELRIEDEAALTALFATADDWFRAATGDLSGPADVQSLFYSLPEGADLDDKQLIVVEGGGELLGLIDLVRHHPDGPSCSIGLFLIRPQDRRRRIGTAVAGFLRERAAVEGITTAVATTPAGWTAGEQFLTSLGFRLDEPRSRDMVGNRRAGPSERPYRRATLSLLPA